MITYDLIFVALHISMIHTNNGSFALLFLELGHMFINTRICLQVFKILNIVSTVAVMNKTLTTETLSTIIIYEQHKRVYPHWNHWGVSLKEDMEVNKHTGYAVVDCLYLEMSFTLHDVKCNNQIKHQLTSWNLCMARFLDNLGRVAVQPWWSCLSGKEMTCHSKQPRSYVKASIH